MSTARTIALATMTGLSLIAASYVFLWHQAHDAEEDAIQAFMDYTGASRSEALEFFHVFTQYRPFNQTVLAFATSQQTYPLTTSKIYNLTRSFSKTVTSVHTLSHVEDTNASDFVAKWPALVVDDGVNVSDAQLYTYRLVNEEVVDRVLNQYGSQDDRLFILDELVPHLPHNVTIEQAYHVIDHWFALFEQCNEVNIPVVGGDVDDDGVDNLSEIFEHNTHPLVYTPFEQNERLRPLIDAGY